MSTSMVHRQTREPVYRQICDILAREIYSHYEAGDALPAEPQLAARFSVNRHTVRRAVDELVRAGLVERRHGRGTFVLEPAIAYTIGSGTRFTDTLTSLGHATESTVERMLVVDASGGVASRLRISTGEPVCRIDTIRNVDGSPYCLITHFLPYKGFEPLLEEYQGGSLHQYLRSRFGLELRRAESLITSVLPLGDDARLLRMSQSQPLLRVKSVNLDVKTGTPVEYALARWRADRVQLRLAP